MGTHERCALPEFPLPAGYVSSGAYFEEEILGAFRKMSKRLGAYRDGAVRRVHDELAIIKRGYPEYFLIVFDLIHWARRHKLNIRVKGAINSSYIAYVDGIVNHDPLAEGHHFEDFINPLHAEHTLPDIDLATTRDGREQLIMHLVEHYGKEHVALIKNYPRGVILCKRRISTIVPVFENENGMFVADCSVRKVLEKNLVKIDIDIEEDHPMVVECLRATNGELVYHQQLAEMIALISGKDYAWSTLVAKSLRVHDLENCAKLKAEFFAVSLANSNFRRGIWAREHTAKAYLERLWTKWSSRPFYLHSYPQCHSGDKMPRFVTSREVIGRVSFADIGNALDRGERVVILVRHAERPPLDQDDPTHGKDLPLTDYGKSYASKFGFELREATFPHPIQVYTSEMKRCRQTAMRIARQAMVGSNGAQILDVLGDKTPYFLLPKDCLAEATDRLENILLTQRSYLDTDNKPDVKVFVTHDVNVGGFLAGRDVPTLFDENNKPYFLDAAVIFIGKNGRCFYGHLPSIERVEPLYLP